MPPVRITLCIFVVHATVLNFADAVCNKVYDRGVSETEQQFIVDKHNELRLLIANEQLLGQPRGINLKRMKWDQRLADEAQKIADLCEFKHKKVEDDRFYVGQNIYMSMATNYNILKGWNEGIQSWFDEYQIYRYPNVDYETGHYTQVIWATSEYVGCGYMYFCEAGHYGHNKMHVCNYGPGGNVVGEAPYETGDSGCENLC